MIIKAISPLFRYDGEPSVSNGIMYQLPSSHLFIHWVPAKLSNRVYALWRILLPATALVCLWLLTDLTGSAQHWFSGRFAVSPLCWSSADRDCLPCLLRVPFQNPAQFQKYLELSRILESFFPAVYAAALCTLSGYRISFSSFFGSYFFPVFSIV